MNGERKPEKRGSEYRFFGRGELQFLWHPVNLSDDLKNLLGSEKRSRLNVRVLSYFMIGARSERYVFELLVALERRRRILTLCEQPGTRCGNVHFHGNRTVSDRNDRIRI